MMSGMSDADGMQNIGRKYMENDWDGDVDCIGLFYGKEDLFDKSAKKKFTNIYKRQSMKTS